MFIENIGNASTTGWYKSNKLGYNVNCASYRKGGEIVVKVESSGQPLNFIPAKRFNSEEDYENWKDQINSGNGRLAIDALEIMGVKTAWS